MEVHPRMRLNSILGLITSTEGGTAPQGTHAFLDTDITRDRSTGRYPIQTIYGYGPILDGRTLTYGDPR